MKPIESWIGWILFFMLKEFNLKMIQKYLNKYNIRSNQIE